MRKLSLGLPFRASRLLSSPHECCVVYLLFSPALLGIIATTYPVSKVFGWCGVRIWDGISPLQVLHLLHLLQKLKPPRAWDIPALDFCSTPRSPQAGAMPLFSPCLWISQIYLLLTPCPQSLARWLPPCLPTFPNSPVTRLVLTEPLAKLLSCTLKQSLFCLSVHLTSNAGENQLRPRDLLMLTHFAEQMCIVEASQMKEAGLCYERMLLWIGQTMGETIPKISLEFLLLSSTAPGF